MVLECEPKRGLDVRARNLEILREMTKKNLAEMEEGLWFKHSPLIASNQQPSKGAPAASLSHYKLEVKITV